MERGVQKQRAPGNHQKMITKFLALLAGAWPRIEALEGLDYSAQAGSREGREGSHFMIVVSDLVGTLSKGSPILGLVNWVRHNQSALQANMFMLKMLPRYILYKLGMMDLRDFGEWSLIASLPLIKDPTPEKVREMALWSVEKVLWPQRREDVVERLAQHKEQGDELYIASTAFEPTLEALGEKIGASAIGSQIEVADGQLQLVSGLITGKSKGEQVFERLGVERVGAAYGDTWADIPILERADHPVAVYPDARLRAAAVERGWEIMDGPNLQ